MELAGHDKFGRRLAGRKRRDDVEDRGEAEERPTCEETECRMDGAADPSIGGTGFRSPPVEIGKCDGDADHRQECDGQCRRSGGPNGGDERRGAGGNRIGRRRAGDSHDDCIEQAKRPLPQRTIQRSFVCSGVKCETLKMRFFKSLGSLLCCPRP